MLCNYSITRHASSKYVKEDVADLCDVVQTTQRLAQASRALSRADQTEIQKVAEVPKDVMRDGTEKLVGEAALLPMLFGKSADGTLLVIFRHYSSRLPSGSVVHHKAKQTEEVP